MKTLNIIYRDGKKEKFYCEFTFDEKRRVLTIAEWTKNPPVTTRIPFECIRNYSYSMWGS